MLFASLHQRPSPLPARFKPLPPALTVLVVSAALSLAACSSVSHAPDITKTAATPGNVTVIPVAPAKVADHTEKPIKEPEPLVVERSAPPFDQALYRDRPDAMRLADELSSGHKLPAEWTREIIANARYRVDVTRLIMPAANPGAKNWSAYKTRFIEPQRIKAGQHFWRAHAAALERAESTYGVPAKIIAGIIGVETLYGRDKGRIRVLDALTTLSLDFPKGRSDRSAFFRKELGEFLVLCREQGLEPTAVLGSFAGAIGWPQFMPSSIRRHGVDFDGNGRIDLINSPVDAIGSVASFLAASGWQAESPTHFSIEPPSHRAQLGKLLAPDILPTFTAQQMQELGAQLPQIAQGHEGPLALVLLHNANKPPTFIAGTQNFYAITRYNQSSYYALAVIELAQAVSSANHRINRQ